MRGNERKMKGKQMDVKQIQKKSKNITHTHTSSLQNGCGRLQFYKMVGLEWWSPRAFSGGLAAETFPGRLIRPEMSIETEVDCLPAGSSGGCRGPQRASETDLRRRNKGHGWEWKSWTMESMNIHVSATP